MTDPTDLTLTLTHKDKPIADLTEAEVTIMEPGERVVLVNAAQQHIARGGTVSPEQSASLTRLLVYIRRRSVKDNPRASTAAKAAAEVQPAGLDDI